MEGGLRATGHFLFAALAPRGSQPHVISYFEGERRTEKIRVIIRKGGELPLGRRWG